MAKPPVELGWKDAYALRVRSWFGRLCSLMPTYVCRSEEWRLS